MRRVNYIFFGLIITILVTLLQGCKHADADFEVVLPADSGITFQNQLLAKENFNILYYLYYYNGGGVAAGDINNDGLTDLYFTANSPGGNKLYLNKGNFQFEDITQNAGVAGVADWCTGVTMADVNADGFLDIYVCAIGNQYGLKGANELYLNKGNGTFEPVAQKMGLAFCGLSTQAAFFDYDHDGDLDMFLLNQSKRPHANVVPASNRMKFDSLSGDRLYRQDQVGGAIRFTEVGAQAGIYQSNLGYGLGLAVADFNNDGWEDIYIGNDFHENDYYYLNNKNGTFTESGADHFEHYSRFSMGNDAADINNDGQTDLITLDMLPPEEKILKTYGSDENPNVYKVKLGLNGYQDQYSRNCLQINNGNGQSYSDVALKAGVSATDWSWSALFADLDNDGNKDLFISSGIVKRPVDLDYVQFVSAMQQNKGLEITDKFDEETIAKMPDGASHPFVFKGDGKAGFSEITQRAGLDKMSGYYNGTALADLDNDGDLDVVMNCINAQAVILKNNQSPQGYLRVNLKGSGLNTGGIGAKVYLFADSGMQVQQLMPTRGFQSAGEPILHFGLGSQKVDSLLVVWPDQRFQVLKTPALNSLLALNQENAQGVFSRTEFLKSMPYIFDDITDEIPVNVVHRENDFIDFNRQYLIPHQQSTRGPKVAVADVNGDSLEDFFICGASGQAGSLMLQQPGGHFVIADNEVFEQYKASEEVDAVFADFNADGSPDLYVVSGGYQFEDSDPVLGDHLYLNDGKGNFYDGSKQIPFIGTNKSCVVAADFDGDKHIDLFVGGLANSGTYGTVQPSYLLYNDGQGRFFYKDVLPALTAGMVTSAQAADFDQDGRMDIVVAGEWMPVTLLMNKKNGWKAQPIAGSSGLWQSLYIKDINADGKPDILAGNWGLNSKLASGKEAPLKMFIKDFDNNGRVEQVVAYTMNGKEYTFLAKDELERAIPVLKKAYLTYGEVAGETVQYLFYDLFKEYKEWEAQTLASTLFINEGKDKFTPKVLPDRWQWAPVFAFASQPGSDVVYAGGNFYGVVPYEGRYDALRFSGYYFGKGATAPVFKGQMPEVFGQVRDAKWIRINNRPSLLLARNNESLRILQLKTK